MLKSYTLRVSVLENCQLRCSYCVPNHSSLSKKPWLSLEQYALISKALQVLPIDKIRFTGGEPLLRRELPSIVQIFRNDFPRATLAVTTNGLKFCEQADPLKTAGITQVTFHLDSLDQNKYRRYMGHGNVDEIIKAMQRAKDLGFFVKLNMVAQKGINNEELCSFLHLSKDMNITVRFIELMNTGSAKEHVQKHFMSGREILATIAQTFSITSRRRIDRHSPAEEYYVQKLDVNFGLIASDTQPFCENCNRLRLSADGYLRGCLYETQGMPLLQQDPQKISQVIIAKTMQKESFHPLQRKNRSDFSMAHIGG